MRRLFPLAKFLARAALVVAVGLIVCGLVVAVASFHVMSAPYRATRREKGDRAARMEAAVAIFTALYALYQTRPRTRRAPLGGDDPPQGGGE